MSRLDGCKGLSPRPLLYQGSLTDGGLTKYNDTVLGSGVWLVPMRNTTVDFVPCTLLVNATAIVEDERAAVKIAEPQDPRGSIVLVDVSLASHVSVHNNLGFVVPPLRGNRRDGLPHKTVDGTGPQRIAFKMHSLDRLVNLHKFRLRDIDAEAGGLPTSIGKQELEGVHLRTRSAQEG